MVLSYGYISYVGENRRDWDTEVKLIKVSKNLHHVHKNKQKKFVCYNCKIVHKFPLNFQVATAVNAE